MKRNFELIIPIDFWEAKEILHEKASFTKRCRIEDIYFESSAGDIARLRRQDTISKLSCTKPLNRGITETIVLDFRASQELLSSLGFTQVERVAVTRDIFRYQHYAVYLDQVDTIGEFLIMEAEAGRKRLSVLEKSARKVLRSLEIPWEPENHPALTAIDTTGALPYTKAIKFAA